MTEDRSSTTSTEFENHLEWLDLDSPNEWDWNSPQVRRRNSSPERKTYPQSHLQSEVERMLVNRLRLEARLREYSAKLVSYDEATLFVLKDHNLAVGLTIRMAILDKMMQVASARQTESDLSIKKTE
jgi:hypothetical protein